MQKKYICVCVFVLYEWTLSLSSTHCRGNTAKKGHKQVKQKKDFQGKKSEGIGNGRRRILYYG